MKTWVCYNLICLITTKFGSCINSCAFDAWAKFCDDKIAVFKDSLNTFFYKNLERNLENQLWNRSHDLVSIWRYQRGNFECGECWMWKFLNFCWWAKCSIETSWYWYTNGLVQDIVVSPLLTYCRYCSLVLSLHFIHGRRQTFLNC